MRKPRPQPKSVYTAYRGWLFATIPWSRTDRMRIYRPEGLAWTFDCQLGGGVGAAKKYIAERVRKGATNVPQLELLQA